MTTFDYCVLGFIPVSIVLILIQFVMADWDLDELMFRKEQK